MMRRCRVEWGHYGLVSTSERTSGYEAGEGEEGGTGSEEDEISVWTRARRDWEV